MNEHNDSRVGQMWVLSDYERLTEALLAGLEDDEVVEATGRSAGALHARARFLLPAPPEDEPRETRWELWVRLREHLRVDPDYDWVARVNEVQAEAGLPFWDDGADTMLRQAWERQHPGLPALAEQLSLQESQVARRLLYLDVAQSSAEVVDRLGCTPGSTLEINSRLARDKQSAMVWVLTVADNQGGVFHVSLHPGHEVAAHTRDELSPTDADDRDWRKRWHWTIAQRVVGEGSVRDEEHGSFHPNAEPKPNS